MNNRQFGIFPLSGNFEIQYAGSIDPRNNIESKNLLFEESTWLSTDNSIYIYNGMPVIVCNDQNIENNVSYMKSLLPLPDCFHCSRWTVAIW